MLIAPFDPVKLTDVDVVFPANALEYMPAMKDIPEKYKHRNAWSPLFMEWFTKGLDKDVEFEMVMDIDGETAYRHLSAILGSFAPKHEHKEAAFTFLCSLWFISVTNRNTTYEEIS